MSESCDHNCSECSANCDANPESMLEKPHDLSDIKHVIGVVSGKGGVGKSLVTSLLAVSLHRQGFQTAILDADVTGPSIPKMFGVRKRAQGTERGILPVETPSGLKMMSVNLLLEHDTDPVVWRGPVIAGVVKQFWSDVIWYDVDYMLVDMPPGTGDVPLTVFQSIPVDGIIVVSSPQELVGMIVGKAVKMAEVMNIPILGLVENMSYFECPNCHERHDLFGRSRLDDVMREYGIPNGARIPVDPRLAAACDRGKIELFAGEWLDSLTDSLTKKFR